MTGPIMAPSGSPRWARGKAERAAKAAKVEKVEKVEKAGACFVLELPVKR